MDIKNVKEISKWPLNPNWHEPLFIKISTVVTTIIAVIIERVGGVLGRGSIAVVKFHVRIRWCVQVSSAVSFPGRVPPLPLLERFESIEEITDSEWTCV